MDKAREGFHDLGEMKNEIDALAKIGIIKYYLYDAKGAIEIYQQACDLASSVQYDSQLMSILRDQRNLSEQLGDIDKTLTIGNRMDSLAFITNDYKVKFDYYNYLGDDNLHLMVIISIMGALDCSAKMVLQENSLVMMERKA